MTPELLLACSTCPAVGTWLVPRPGMLEMVREIAAHAGWQEEPCRCPECRKPVESEAPPPLARGDRLHWSPRLMTLVGDLRRQRMPWREVAQRLSVEVGFPVATGRVMNGFSATMLRRAAA